MTEVFADAFDYIALLNPTDRHHAAAIRQFTTMKRPAVTTAWVLTEVADAFSSPATRRTTHRFLGELAARTRTRIIPPGEDLFHRGLALYGARPDKSWSLTEHQFRGHARAGPVRRLDGRPPLRAGRVPGRLQGTVTAPQSPHQSVGLCPPRD